MAFQQPTRWAASRVARRASVQDDNVVAPPRPCSPEREAHGSQNWVLFAPPTDVTTTSYLTESDHSLETPGRSRLSDLASLNTVARSEAVSVAQPPSILSAADDDASGDDDAELDSLDSHLPDFRSVPGLHSSQPGQQQHATPLFPSHDGLGSFRLDRPVIDSDAQDQIFEFEKFNPRKIRRRLDSFDHAPSPWNLGDVYPQQEEKRQRIEAWRLEHSRVLVDEVEREARRRQKSLASMHRSKGASLDADADNLSWHDEDAMQQTGGDQESPVATMTKKIVRQLFGIDGTMLSILLGQELPAAYQEMMTSAHGYSSDAHRMSAPTNQTPWQMCMMERLSREIGLLVNHLSPHPGAFATYSAMQRMALPYAGLPVIPESCDAGAAEARTEAGGASQVLVPEFQPTMATDRHRHRHRQSMDTAGRKQSIHDQTEDADTAGGHFSQEEWEKSLDIKLVFRYLVSRFTSSPDSDSPPPPAPTPTPTPTQQDNAAKMARIRQHHPLTTRSGRPAERRSLKAATPNSPVALRRQSSCASQSTRRSARRSSCSSRHYWDVGGSLGTGSVIASNGPMGPMGSWGEV
ncbi:hypothetical protein E4U42_007492 [Claviceps africana]|uniref:Uncharacterized protein n=1 Tax=Claviceps africana TaxID=83212 RepID=A0A8K0JGT1_9HYPO|nr:hypothetical protein E4U42_007492 [Claviceps africana]